MSHVVVNPDSTLAVLYRAAAMVEKASVQVRETQSPTTTSTTASDPGKGNNEKNIF
jgi:hypothetical protein